MMRLLAAFLGLCIALPAAAQSIVTIWGTSPTSYLLDGQPAATRAFALQRLLTAYSTNKLVNIRRASDNATTDIGFVATGAIDTATAVTFCAATTCFVTIWYDQTGTANIVQATAGNQPAFIFNCLGTNPCVQFTASTMSLAGAANITPATGIVSFNIVANRAVGTGGFTFFRENGINNRMSAPGAGTNTWQIVGTGLLTGVASDGSWHSGIGVINGASSVVTIDGTQTTGTVTGNTTAGAPAIQGAASTTGNMVSVILWDNVALSATARSMITANQRAWWGF